MVICHDFKILYFPLVKTGSVTLTEVLKSEFGGQIVRARHQCFVPEECKDYFAFASIRNPYSRYLSAYNYYAVTDRKIELMDLHQRLLPMFNSLFLQPVKQGEVPVRINAYIRTETLERDFNNLPFVESHIGLPRLNQSEPVLDRLPEDAVKMIQGVYYHDFICFGYAVEPVPA